MSRWGGVDEILTGDVIAPDAVNFRWSPEHMQHLISYVT